MKQTLLVAAMVIAVASLASGQKPIGKDQEAVRQVVQELTEAVVQGDTEKLDRLQADEFKGEGGGLSLSRKQLHDALQNGDAKVSSWTVDNLQVTVRGSSAVATGRCKLTGASYRGKEYSGSYRWTGRFVRQKDGGWRAVSLATSKTE